MRKTERDNIVWDEILSALKENVSSYAYKNWFEGSTTLLKIGTKGIVIGVPNNTYRSVLKNKFESVLKTVCRQIIGHSVKIKISIVDHLNTQIERDRDRSITEALEEHAKSISPPKIRRKIETAFKRKVKKVTSDELIKGSFNKIAVSAADHVVQFDKDCPNPLFIYGESGMGKTFLLQYMYHEAIKNGNGDRNVVFTSSEAFMNDYINSLKGGTIGKFRNHYRDADLLLIDDIHFLADGNKESTREESFHTVNELLDKGKQVVITCDTHPNNLKILGSRLMKRLMGGMWVQLNRPDTENRLKILKASLRNFPVDVPNEVLHFICETHKSDIRGMIGAFTTAIRYCTYAGEEITLPLIKDALGYHEHDEGIPKGITVTPQDIVKESARYFGIDKAQILSESRSRNIVNARHVAIYLCNTFIPDISLGDLAVYFRSSRPAILYAGNKVTRELKLNHRVIKPAVSEISRSLESSF